MAEFDEIMKTNYDNTSGLVLNSPSSTRFRGFANPYFNHFGIAYPEERGDAGIDDEIVDDIENKAKEYYESLCNGE